MAPARSCSRPIATPVAASALALGLLLTLPGCGSTPEKNDVVPNREPVAGSVADAADEMQAGGGGAAATADGEVPVLRQTSDTRGAPRAYTLVLIDDPAGLPAPVLNALRPDFDAESVIFLGMGEQVGEGYGARITGVRRAGSELTVAAEFARPSGAASGDATTPWSAVVIPRQDGVDGPLLSDFR